VFEGEKNHSAKMPLKRAYVIATVKSEALNELPNHGQIVMQRSERTHTSASFNVDKAKGLIAYKMKKANVTKATNKCKADRRQQHCNIPFFESFHRVHFKHFVRGKSRKQNA